MLNTRFMVALGMVIILLIGLGCFFYGLQPILTESVPVEFKIAKSESFRSIGARLSQQSLIRSIGVFKLYSLLVGRAGKFQPGIYEISSEMSVPSIVGKLTVGGANEIRVTIPEGLTVKDIDTLLVETGVFKEAQIKNYAINSLSEKYPFLKQMNSLEGFLFPDTYRFDIDSEPKEVVEIILERFKEKVWERLEDRDNWYDDLILASFLEKEVPEYEDRRLVAGLLLKRLGASVPLQIDSTILYAKCQGRFLSCDKEKLKVVRNDLDQIISPYNTYKRMGWTPTPISNPGVEAVRAAINPEPSPYWYYLSAKDSGETVFSKTLEQHNINRFKYLN